MTSSGSIWVCHAAISSLLPFSMTTRRTCIMYYVGGGFRLSFFMGRYSGGVFKTFRVVYAQSNEFVMLVIVKVK